VLEFTTLNRTLFSDYNKGTTNTHTGPILQIRDWTT